MQENVATYWVQSLELTEADRKILVGGHWLTDNHIFAAMKLLKEKYPQQNGLASTQLLAKKLLWKSSNTDFVQIVHVSGNHWVCVSNKHCAPGVCDIYDSMPASNSPTLIRQVAAILKCTDPSFKMRYSNVQMQAGADDCGLFSIAFATALCAGKDPHKCSFQQSEMRSHLKLCFERGELAMFPTSKPRRCASSIKSTKNFEVYCTCRLPWDRNTSLFGNLAQCAKCRDWFHQRCMNIATC